MRLLKDSARIEDEFQSLAAKRVEEQVRDAPDSQESGSNGQAAVRPGESGCAQINVPTDQPVLGNLADAKERIRSIQALLLAEVMPKLVTDPDEATCLLESKLPELMGKNEIVTNVFDVLGLKEGRLSRPVDWGALAKGLSDSIDHITDIEAYLKQNLAKRCAGRPFGAKNHPKRTATGDDAGEDVSQKKRRKKNKQISSGSKEELKSGSADPGSTDAFADLEEQTKVNKVGTIPLYTKCLIVEYAKTLIAAGNTKQVEMEVMQHFKKYFWSIEAGRYKSGLLSKWMARLGPIG